jgi:hypothetical protein
MSTGLSNAVEHRTRGSFQDIDGAASLPARHEVTDGDSPTPLRQDRRLEERFDAARPSHAPLTHDEG